MFVLGTTLGFTKNQEKPKSLLKQPSDSTTAVKITIPLPESIRSENVAILKEYFTKMYQSFGLNVEYKSIPLIRINQLFEKGELDLNLMAAAGDYTTMNVSMIPTPLYSFKIYRWCLKEKCERLRTQDPTKLKGVALRGLKLFDVLPPEDLKQIQYVARVNQLLEMLEAGRVDYILSSQPGSILKDAKIELLHDYGIEVKMYHWISKRFNYLRPRIIEYFSTNPLRLK